MGYIISLLFSLFISRNFFLKKFFFLYILFYLNENFLLKIKKYIKKIVFNLNKKIFK